MYVSLELTQSVVHWATMVVATGDADALADAAVRVGRQTSRGGRHVGREAVELHGGIATTAEYSVGSLAAQFTLLDHLLGDGHHHLRHLADRGTTTAWSSRWGERRGVVANAAASPSSRRCGRR